MVTASHSAQGQATHRPEPNESLFFLLAPRFSALVTWCELLRAAELLRADQLLIVSSLYPAVGVIMSECVCCERVDIMEGERSRNQKEQEKQNTLDLLWETRDAYFIQTS